MSDKSAATLHQLWSRGQDHLVAGRYVAARSALEAAEAIAWRNRDLQSLARIYLPLLEARRQIRYNAAEGVILITAPKKSYSSFLHAPAGTLLLLIPSIAAAIRKAQLLAITVERHARRTGQWLETVFLLSREQSLRLVSPMAPSFSTGIPITHDTAAALAASTDPALVLPFPGIGEYKPGPVQALARESLLIGWEALALKWQHRHPCHAPLTPWRELEWLRKTLRIDPACEPVTMRLIALAESLARLNVAPVSVR